MKVSIIILFLILLPLSLLAQDSILTVGRGTNCFGRGACSLTSIQNRDSNAINASFIYTADGKTLLRVYRNKLSKDDEIKLLGAAITARNKNTLTFLMEEPLQLTKEITELTSRIKSKQLQELAVGTYTTTISDQFIDIEIVPSEN